MASPIEFHLFPQESDKEEMKEILEMKRVHERLAKKRQVERDQRKRERKEMCDKILGLNAPDQVML